MKKFIVLTLIVSISMGTINVGTMRTNTPITFLSNITVLDSLLIVGKRIEKVTNSEGNVTNTGAIYTPITVLDSLIVKYSREEGVPTLLVAAQFIEESAKGTSNVAKRCNNGFGHRYGIFNKKTRKTRYYYKVYKDMEESIKAHCSLLKRLYTPSTGTNDLDYWIISLNGYNDNNKQYAENPSYTRNLKSIIKQLKNK